MAATQLPIQVIVQGERAAQAAIKGLGKTTQSVSKQINSVSKEIFKIGAVATAGIGLAVKEFATFEQSMANVRAITKPTAEEFEKLNDVAREMGATTVFTATQSAEALQFLGMAGFEADEAIAALPNTLNLAAAAGMDLGRTADIMSNVMSQFNIEASDSAKVADVLAATVSSSNTNMEQLSDAMKFLGPTASAFGVSIEESAAAVGILGDSGIQGSLATRALSTAMTRLAQPTTAMQKTMNELGLEFFDANGEFVGLAGTVQQLEGGFEGLTDQQKQAALSTLFGAEALQEMNTLLNAGSGELIEYTKELENSGGRAQEMADIQLDTLQGQFKLLKSALSETAIALGEALLPVLTQMAEDILPIIQSVGEWIGKNPELAATIAKVVVGVTALSGALVLITGPLATILGPIGTLATSIGGMAAVTTKVGVATGAFATALGGLTIALAAIDIAIIAAAVGAFNEWRDAVAQGVELTNQFAAANERHIESMQRLREQYELTAQQTELANAIDDMRRAQDKYNQAIDEGTGMQRIAAKAELDAATQKVTALGKEQSARADANEQLRLTTIELAKNARASDATVKKIAAVGKELGDMDGVTKKTLKAVTDMTGGLSLTGDEMVKVSKKAAKLDLGQLTEAAEVMAKDGEQAMNQFVDGITSGASEAEGASEAGAQGIAAPQEANVAAGQGWGLHMMANMTTGIQVGGVGAVGAATQVAGQIAAVLAHTVPKKGPLADELSWMPHMMQNLAKGIDDNAFLLSSALFPPLEELGDTVEEQMEAMDDITRDAIEDMVDATKDFVESIDDINEKYAEWEEQNEEITQEIEDKLFDTVKSISEVRKEYGLLVSELEGDVATQLADVVLAAEEEIAKITEKETALNEKLLEAKEKLAALETDDEDKIAKQAEKIQGINDEIVALKALAVAQDDIIIKAKESADIEAAVTEQRRLASRDAVDVILEERQKEFDQISQNTDAELALQEQRKQELLALQRGERVELAAIKDDELRDELGSIQESINAQRTAFEELQTEYAANQENYNNMLFNMERLNQDSLDRITGQYRSAFEDIKILQSGIIGGGDAGALLGNTAPLAGTLPGNTASNVSVGDVNVNVGGSNASPEEIGNIVADKITRSITLSNLGSI